MATAALGAILPGLGDLFSGLLGNSAAQNAAKLQGAAANQAGADAYAAGQQGLDFQRQVYGDTQNMLSPYYQVGQSSLANLANLLGVLPSSATYTPFTPTLQAGAVSSPQLDAVNNQIQTIQSILGGLGGGTFKPGEVPHNAGTIAKMQNQIATLERQRADLQSQQYGQQSSSAPQQSLSSLVNPSLGASGSLLSPFQAQFQAPTGVTEQNDPGYQFRLQEGQKALERSAAARGGLLTGATAKAEQRYGQDYASKEYGDVYNRALQQYQLPQQNALDIYGMLTGQSGVGQQSAAQLGSLGQSAANTTGNILLNSAQQQGNALEDAANARASGYVGGANALGSALGGGISSLAALLNRYGKNKGFTPYGSSYAVPLFGG